jgi:ubiquinone/menaquinone biosynthesis C-methylase UbiE
MYLKHARRSGSPILELGCGTGRILIPLAKAGFRVVGLDLYSPMLKVADEKIAQLGNTIQRRISLIQADISRFSLKQCFNIAYISANTIFHLSRQEQRKCLECARDVLKPGGTIIIDCESPDSMSTAQECVGMLSRYDDYSKDDSGKTESVRSWITCVDLANHRMKVKTEITEKISNAKVEKYTYNHTFHWFDRIEMERLLYECGFRTTHIYGDWDMRNFSEGDHRMIFVADKKTRLKPFLGLL